MVEWGIYRFKPGQLWINGGGKFLIEKVELYTIQIYYFEKGISKVWDFELLANLTEDDMYLGEISSLEKELL